MRDTWQKTGRLSQCLMVIGVGLALSGCLSYSSDFGCKGYPDGVNCQSVSSVYDMDHDGAVPALRGRNVGASGSRSQLHLSSEGPMLGRPVVTPPEVLRVWITPWRDGDNRLHEGSYVYVLVKEADFAYGVPVLSEGRKKKGRVITPLRGITEESGQPREELSPPSPSSRQDTPSFSSPIPNGTSSLLPDLQKKAFEQGGLDNMDKAAIFDHVLKQQGR